ncbi:hypothetical protein B0T14DRAFT_512449 [Immersiella caudata]|uniref:Uncharacterized protein n=1 Tax=Immersiella caudata TaxID=314043 RepID=A0AA39X4U9_9PEZI|nr:hypothetical protein B0T14DRAFT_512449 [Immersiella caudata]
MSTIVKDPDSANPPNPFTSIIAPLFSTTNSEPQSETLTTIATTLITTVSTSPNPSTALWQLWDTILIPTSHSLSAHNPTLSLLRAITSHPPTVPSNIDPADPYAAHDLASHISPSGHLVWSSLPRFSWSWRDFHDGLEANRDRFPRGDEKAEYFPNFVEFSARFLKEWGKEGEVHPINVFYACRNGLEERMPEEDGKEGGGEGLSKREVWQVDVRVAAMWLKFGAGVLWEVEEGYLREHFARTLDWGTGLWEEGKGLTRERWALWAQRLRELVGEKDWNGDVKALMGDAAEVVEGLLVRK